ncbi:MAG TPA: response regulator [Herpetosiphon sp.]|jgi:two-component system, response regulator PdtaR|uniref:Response regulator receiver and ANTAR domain protein n=2 Tax=Herpetosiphon TaxID=64 RepID=A9AYU9_HERA2|nr:response regulator [Herpetosiphon sp.]ABX06989.1 response regulator receiver and ANTAR domain protein [Herpetosiphon aurantiacus DSM 785]MCA0355226.1 response regulator [Chloroflexota bacterium]HBW52703.1 response regulator [Herpetosiphon sp.]
MSDEQRATIRILLAEDNELVALTMEEYLTDLGFQVVGVARTGTQALELARQLEPDMAILDVKLPELEGTEVAARLYAERPMPIVMVTAFTDRDTIRKAERAGALGYLVKPVTMEALTPAIDIALARFAEIRALRQEVDALHESLEARKLIERAKGILMQRLNISEHDAYERLRHRAREKRVKLKDIAQTIIDAEALLS